MPENSIKYSKRRLERILSDVAQEYFFESSYPVLLQTSRMEYLHMLLNLLRRRKIPTTETKVLGIGCGPGFNLLVLKSLGFTELIGIDILPPDNWPLKKPLSFQYLTRDVCNSPLPFNDESFHVVLLIDVLEHLYDPAPLLREIQRVLKVGGLLVIRMPNIANLRNRILLLCGRSFYPRLEDFLFRDRIKGSRIYLGHVREYTGNELRQMLSWFSIRILNLKYFCAEPSIKSRKTLLKLNNLFENLYPKWKSTIVALTEKERLKVGKTLRKK